MKNRKKRKQREEVRRILHAIRLELAAQRVVDAEFGKSRRLVSISDILKVNQYEL